MCALPRMAVFCSSLISYFPVMFRHFLKDFQMVPDDPIVTVQIFYLLLLLLLLLLKYYFVCFEFASYASCSFCFFICVFVLCSFCYCPVCCWLSTLINNNNNNNYYYYYYHRCHHISSVISSPPNGGNLSAMSVNTLKSQPKTTLLVKQICQMTALALCRNHRDII
jgi:hypothetical protein